MSSLPLEFIRGQARTDLQEPWVLFRCITMKTLRQLCMELLEIDRSRRADDLDFAPGRPLFEAASNWFAKLRDAADSYNDEAVAQTIEYLRSANVLSHLRELRSCFEYLQELEQVRRCVETPRPLHAVQSALRASYAGSALFDDFLQLKLSKVGRNCLVAGSGPMPSTALLLNDIAELQIACLDIQQESCIASEQLLGAIEYPVRVRQVVADAAEWTGYEEYDVVLINGLVGVGSTSELSLEKAAIVERVAERMKAGSLLL